MLMFSRQSCHLTKATSWCHLTICKFLFSNCQYTVLAILFCQ
ncbi:hypothetical protein [Moraxella lacunata]